MKYQEPELRIIGMKKEDVVTISREDWGSGGGTNLATIEEMNLEIGE